MILWGSVWCVWYYVVCAARVAGACARSCDYDYRRRKYVDCT